MLKRIRVDNEEHKTMEKEMEEELGEDELKQTPPGVILEFLGDILR